MLYQELHGVLYESVESLELRTARGQLLLRTALHYSLALAVSLFHTKYNHDRCRAPYHTRYSSMQEYEATDPCPSDDPADRASYRCFSGISHSADGLQHCSVQAGGWCGCGTTRFCRLPTLSMSRNQDPGAQQRLFFPRRCH